MKHAKLETMVKGWFVGNFNPTLYRTNDVEVAIKTYKAGDDEKAHHHKIATELTAVVSGEIEMNGKRYHAGDIVVVEPGESCSFRAITDSTNVVVKLPGANNDKYLDE
jgi:quercetin dioxygenase-like cupin family protein